VVEFVAINPLTIDRVPTINSKMEVARWNGCGRRLEYVPELIQWFSPIDSGTVATLRLLDYEGSGSGLELSYF
jgi:hypothetical protein